MNNETKHTQHDDSTSTICHHCGKLLDQQEKMCIVDPAFSENAGIEAYHCKPCLQHNHPKAYLNYSKSIKK